MTALSRRAAIVTLLLAGCLGLTGCGASGPAAPEPDGATGGTAAGSAAPIFDPEVLHDARIEIDPAAWQELREHYLGNQYYAADLTVDGAAVRQVGIRSRGDASRNAEKPGLRVEFDKYVPGQEFYGYKSLHLDNLATDASMLRERLAFRVFEAMGIPAPRNAFAHLAVNGEDWGVYAIVEPVSRPFLRERLGDDSGTLFDYEWAFPYDFSWLGENPARYAPSPFEPETNERDAGVADGLVAFVRAINETPEESFSETIRSYVDVDRLLTYVAVENAICEVDGLLGDQGLNNFYLYEYGQGRRFVFVPWDKDSSFSEPSWPLYRNLDGNVLVRRLTDTPAGRAYYAAMVERAVRDFVNPRWLTPQLESAWQQIRNAALADTRKPFANDELELAVGGLRTVIAARETDVRAQR